MASDDDGAAEAWKRLWVMRADSKTDTYSHGTDPIPKPDDGNHHFICYAVTSEGALVIGTAVLYSRPTKRSPSFQRFKSRVTYAPGQWAKVEGAS